MLTIRHSRVRPVAEIENVEERLEEQVEEKLAAVEHLPPPPSGRPMIISEKLLAAEQEVIDKHGVDIHDVYGSSRIRHLVLARRDLIKLLHHKVHWGPSRIAEALNLDRTSVMHHLGLRKSSKTTYGALNDD